MALYEVVIARTVESIYEVEADSPEEARSTVGEADFIVDVATESSEIISVELIVEQEWESGEWDVEPELDEEEWE